MIDNITHENLSRNLNTRFRTNIAPDQYVELELTEVSDVKLLSGHEQFSIILHGPAEAFLDQGTRLFAHHDLGEFELFVVPIGRDAQGFLYQAVFNRVSKAPDVKI